MIKYGSQLYTFRKEIGDTDDFKKVMSFLGGEGCECVQLSGLRFGYSAREVKEIADRYSMEIPLTHTPYERIKNDLQRVAEEHCVLGAKTVGLGMMSPAVLKKESSLKEFVEFANETGRKLKPFGLKFGYHNHYYEFRRLKDGRRIIDYIKDESPDTEFIFDTFWCRYAGYDPAKTIRELHGRVESIHVKDWKKSFILPRFKTPGEGDLNFPEILRAAEESGTRYALIEHDTTSRPYEVTRNGLKYLRSLR